MAIHPTAIIDPEAELDSTVEIDPYVIIKGPVRIGAGTRVCAHAVISGRTTIGTNNLIGSFSTVGLPPQDLQYKGEPTELIIGNNNRIREYVSIHRGTTKGTGQTIIGNDNLVMSYCHIAHDCILSDHIVMSNVATLAGHVELHHHCNLGGLVAVHQFSRIGAHAYIGGMSGIGMDVPPYVILEGTRNHMRVAGINKIGLKRAGMAGETIDRLEAAFRVLFRSPELLLKDALAKVESEMADCEEVQNMVEFFKTSKRGVVRSSRKNA